MTFEIYNKIDVNDNNLSNLSNDLLNSDENDVDDCFLFVYNLEIDDNNNLKNKKIRKQKKYKQNKINNSNIENQLEDEFDNDSKKYKTKKISKKHDHCKIDNVVHIEKELLYQLKNEFENNLLFFGINKSLSPFGPYGLHSYHFYK